MPHVMNVANAMWPDNDFPVQQGFHDLVQGEYGGHVQNVDYGNTQQARSTINNWVSQRTFGKIPNLVEQLDPETALVLTNAVYFNGYWESPFDPRHTSPRLFHLDNGEVISTPAMYTITNAPYAVIDGFKVLELPFDGGAKNADYSMIFVLPPENGADDLTSGLYTKIDAWLDNFPIVQGVQISLPKIDTAVDTVLNQLLIGLGMPTAFAPGAADFSGITAGGGIWISRVAHKATLTMNEQGTTAAAATEVQFPICFAAGTPVMTPEGSRRIEELKPGDLVLARDQHNVEGQLQPRRIAKVFHNDAAIVELLVQGRLIRTTEAHPFFVRGKGWLPAGELLPRDLLSSDAGGWVEVNAIQRTQAPEPVFNLQVADDHTYFVGHKEWGFAVWVHNHCGNEPEFFADRPFHLLIRDNITSTIAFMGRIDNPAQAQNKVTPFVVDVSADFNGDQHVDGADFLAWQRGAGMTVDAIRSNGDCDGDGDVDAADLAEWQATYGEAIAALNATADRSESSANLPAASPRTASAAQWLDAAMALQWLTPADGVRELLVLGDAEMLPLYFAPRQVDVGPLPAAAAAVVFDSYATDSVSEPRSFESELDDDLLGVWEDFF